MIIVKKLKLLHKQHLLDQLSVPKTWKLNDDINTICSEWLSTHSPGLFKMWSAVVNSFLKRSFFVSFFNRFQNRSFRFRKKTIVLWPFFIRLLFKKDRLWKKYRFWKTFLLTIMLTIVDEGSSLTIVNKGFSLTKIRTLKNGHFW